MTREQLAEKLDHLNPGSVLRVDADTLARTFDAKADSPELLEEVEAFATEHRCAFTAQEHERAVHCFEKNDIY